MASDQVDRGRGAHREHHAGVAEVPLQQEQEGGDQADPDRHDPRESRQGHATILTRMPDTLTPERAAERLRELSADVRAAVLLDAAGSLTSATEADRARAEKLADRARRLFEEV